MAPERRKANTHRGNKAQVDTGATGRPTKERGWCRTTMATGDQLDTSAVVLGDREFALLLALAEHNVLSTEQIQMLFFNSQRRCQQVLFDLRSRGFINTFCWRSSRAREVDRHYLAPAGAQVLARHLGCGTRDLGDVPADDAAAAKRMAHRSGVNAFFCGIVSQTLTRAVYGLECWTDEHKVTTAFGEVQPDGFGRLLHPGGATEFYFEYDLSTEHRRSLIDKFAKYLRVATHWESIDGRPFPSVLFVVPGDHRELHLLKALLAAVNQWDPSRVRTTHPPLYCSTVTRLRVKGHLGPVWRDMLVRGASRLRLDELPAIDGSEYDLDDCLGRRWRRPGADG